MLFSKTRKLERDLNAASSYDEWRQAAIAQDTHSGLERWKRIDPSREYDYVSIRIRLDRLRSMRAKHDYQGLLFTLNEGIHGNMGGMGNSALYHRASFGTKQLIEELQPKCIAIFLHAPDLVGSVIANDNCHILETRNRRRWCGVIHGCEGQVGASHGQALVLQNGERLWCRNFVNQMQVDVQDSR